MHTGDFAYSIQDTKGAKGDLFFNDIAPGITAKPYIITPGNHEVFDRRRFLNYRFQMPQPPSRAKNLEKRNNFYTFNVKGIQFISINLDYLWPYHRGPDLAALNRIELLTWLDKTLKASQDAKFRFLYTHRPLICGDPLKNECNGDQYQWKPIEDLAYKYKVDVVMNAHVHSYERMNNLYDFKFMDKSKNSYKGPMIVVNGHSGTGHGFVTEKPESYSDVFHAKYLAGEDPNYLILNFDSKKMQANYHVSLKDDILDTFTVDFQNTTNVTNFHTDIQNFFDKSGIKHLSYVSIILIIGISQLVIFSLVGLYKLLKRKNNTRKISDKTDGNVKENLKEDQQYTKIENTNDEYIRA